MAKRLLQYLLEKITKLLERFEKEEPVNEEKTVKTVSEEKSTQKFFGKKTLFDEVKKVQLAISPIKKYSPEKYEEYKQKLDKLNEESKNFYEEKECKNELTLKLTIGTSSYSLELYQKFYELLEDVKQFKKEEYNYEYSFKTLEELKKYLMSVYYKLIAKNTDTNLLIKAGNILSSKLNEISSLDVEENTLKQEELCKCMCECIYIFLKCNARCDYCCDTTGFMEVFSEEDDTFWDIFLENVKDLSEKIKIFKETKYYNRYQRYLQPILEKEDVDYKVLLNEKFLKNFVENEKKIIELHFYYSLPENKSEIEANVGEDNIDAGESGTDIVNTDCRADADEEELNNPDMVKVSQLREYIEKLFSLYKDDESVAIKLHLLENLVSDFKYDITNYEVYKLVYFLGLKTFFISHLKNVEADDLMKKVFVSQKGTKIAPLKKLQNTENIELFRLVIYDSKYIKTLNKLNIYYKVVDNELEEAIYFCAEYFTDCENIMKNLNEVEKIS